MNVETFRSEAKSRGKSTLSNLSYGGLKWSEWYKLATMTRSVEYGCRFGRQIKSAHVTVFTIDKPFTVNDSKDEPITCAKQREYDDTDRKCCCLSCDTNLGYLKFIQNDPKVVKRIASLFQFKVGFWRENKGCILPRKYRSAVCLGYQCGSAQKHKISGKEGMLVLFMDSIRIRRLSDKDIRILGRALLKST